MMRHEAHARHNRVHQEVCELLPWYVNGTLDGRERAAVETHLATCPARHAELRQCRDLAAVRMAAEPAWSPSAEHFSRLLARMEAADAHGTPDGGWRERLRARSTQPLLALQRTPRLVRWALAAQGAMILLLGGVLVWHAPFSPGPRYRTLAEDREHTPRGQARLQVAFTDDMTEPELRALLTCIGGTIVHGPSALGVYTVELSVSEGSPDLVRPILDAVRAHPHVRLAEPTLTR